jgi:hypothetical protein
MHLINQMPTGGVTYRDSGISAYLYVSPRLYPDLASIAHFYGPTGGFSGNAYGTATTYGTRFRERLQKDNKTCVCGVHDSLSVYGQVGPFTTRFVGELTRPKKSGPATRCKERVTLPADIIVDTIQQQF